MSAKGGMAGNPFGGRGRLDLLELMDFRAPNQPVEMVVFLESIKDVLFNYLFFGLGHNGTSLEEFWWATEYLFRVRASDPATWRDAKSVKVVTQDERTGRRKTAVETFSDETLQTMCFDTHYELSGLADLMSIDRFLATLKETRRTIIQENRPQIDRYIDSFRDRQLEQVAKGWRLPLNFSDPKREDLMVHPEDGAELAELFYYEPRLSIPPSKPDVPQTCAPVWEFLIFGTELIGRWLS